MPSIEMTDGMLIDIDSVDLSKCRKINIAKNRQNTHYI